MSSDVRFHSLSLRERVRVRVFSAAEALTLLRQAQDRPSLSQEEREKEGRP